MKLSLVYSATTPKARAPLAEGRGYIESNLAFMETVKQTCEVCQGKRYKMEALAFKYQGKDITEVLKDLTIEEALDFFESAPAIKEKNKSYERSRTWLSDIGTANEYFIWW